jgi:phosphopantothenoylcysteine synthetase/decarboxylase
MKVLVTAGNTLVPIDRVRCLTNIFSGRTGAGLAWHAYERGHQVTLLTSHPEVLRERTANLGDPGRWRCLSYQTFADLEKLMEQHIGQVPQDAVIHCAAVSDYRAAGIFAPASGTQFSAEEQTWAGAPPRLEDRAAGKIKSDEPELWLRLVRTPKLVDRIRSDWGFGGLLVKFKLEVEVDPKRLVEIAEKSRQHSGADWMVANMYQGTLSEFYLGPLATGYECIARDKLPGRLFDLLEQQLRERSHG